MRARAAEVETFYRRAVVGIAEHRPGREQLVERERAVKDVPADEAELALEVERRKYLAREDARLEIRRVTVHRFDDGVGGGFALVVPAAAAARASISPPSASATLVARPDFTRTVTTSALVVISTPRERASFAIASLIAPIPPRACPQVPRLPFTSPNA